MAEASTTTAKKPGLRADGPLRKALQPVGLTVASIGVLVALWAFTGPRALDLSYFYVALGGVGMVLVGILAASLGRALAPRGLAAKKRAAPAAAPAARAPSRPAPAPPAATAAEAPPKRARSTPPLVAPVAAEATLRLRCPACATEFDLPPGSGAVHCPACGAEGDRPTA